jgi:hypothetical protein
MATLAGVSANISRQSIQPVYAKYPNTGYLPPCLLGLAQGPERPLVGPPRRWNVAVARAQRALHGWAGATRPRLPQGRSPRLRHEHPEGTSADAERPARSRAGRLEGLVMAVGYMGPQQLWTRARARWLLAFAGRLDASSCRPWPARCFIVPALAGSMLHRAGPGLRRQGPPWCLRLCRATGSARGSLIVTSAHDRGPHP